MKRGTAMGVAGVGLAAGLLAVGCSKPLRPDTQEALRARLIESHRSYLEATAAGPVVELTRPASVVEEELTREGRIDELDQISGVKAYQGATADVGADLSGRATSPTVTMGLRDVITQAVRNNLDVQVVRLRPAIAQAQLTQAEAAFDAVAFTTFEWNKLDTPQLTGSVPGLTGNAQEDSWTLTTGIRKPLTTGGVFVAQTGLSDNYRDPSLFNVDQYWNTDVTLSLQQPLLRNFGSAVSQAEIQLARNASRAEVQTLRDALLVTALNAETAYWNLYFARQRLLIQVRLLERTIEDRDRLVARREFDAAPVQITEANSFVELRRAEVIRAREEVRNASDTLKQLIQSKDLPVAGEELIVPGESPVDAPLAFSLLDAVTTALQNRAELQTALLQIDDASIRQKVADNQRLPLLNLTATTRFNGVAPEVGDAYDSLTDVNFIDYILGVEFEAPIGNRAAEAAYRQRQLERRGAVLNYQRQARDVVLEVKQSLRGLITSYELIGATRAARRAAADNLRAINEQERAGVQLTPEFINLKLQSQERLADAETQEAQALADYNRAVAAMYRAMGTLLQRNGIVFDPQAATDE